MQIIMAIACNSVPKERLEDHLKNFYVDDVVITDKKGRTIHLDFAASHYEVDEEGIIHFTATELGHTWDELNEEAGIAFDTIFNSLEGSTVDNYVIFADSEYGLIDPDAIRNSKTLTLEDIKPDTGFKLLNMSVLLRSDGIKGDYAFIPVREGAENITFYKIYEGSK